MESRKLLVAQKAQAYSDFIKLTAASTHSRDAETRALIADAKTRICIYGSADVIRRMKVFFRSGAVITHADGEARLTRLLSAMREDVTGKSFEGIEDAVQLLLFGHDEVGPTRDDSTEVKGQEITSHRSMPS